VTTPGGDHLPWAGDWEPVVQAVVGFIDDVARPVTAQAKEPRAEPPRTRHVGWSAPVAYTSIMPAFDFP
jgi:hypothetical protein